MWELDGRDWPNREASRFVAAAGLRWHVQILGQGPVALLLHGTGAATHSWRGLAPALARHFTVVAPDLPGHGFTEAPPPRGFTLPGMAAAVAALLHTVGLRPSLAIGHSAGAAILARMCLDGAIAPKLLVSLNGALLPLTGVPGRIFSPMARLLAATPLVPRVFAWRAADGGAVARLVAGTGSRLDREGIELYGRLIRRPGHVAGALAMMANWDLRPLVHDLPRLTVPLALIVAENDRTVPPAESRRVQRLVPAARLESLHGLGHLAHEERPEEVAALIVRLARGAGALRQRHAPGPPAAGTALL
ncbi:MAG: alpha/beta fold hydrolase [Burkholderiales bacterium]|nr:alpha/beta fold hydrolase [Burkholderiales bacterium]